MQRKQAIDIFSHRQKTWTTSLSWDLHFRIFQPKIIFVFAKKNISDTGFPIIIFTVQEFQSICLAADFKNKHKTEKNGIYIIAQQAKS